MRRREETCREAERRVEFEIKPFDVSHKAQILGLSLRAWAPVFSGLRPAVPEYVYEAFYPHGWRARQRSDIEAFLDTEGDRVWVAVKERAVLGWVGIRLHPEDRMGEIVFLAVDPGHQRHGIGKALLDFALERMRAAGMSIVMVETGDDPGHASARMAYERSGFERWPVARYFREL
ncbi:MAG TPA: GNAT family N-acetyltransferase [Armatimonadetes bacterium]|jgi:GNAT superfamily N-acetyltransferase|nr:GNAT family N-acetyltransferase [Armatimonadota bacterium]HHX38539.1 GNAT family N-acetyltransferase [Armatimonadota bacterium]